MLNNKEIMKEALNKARNGHCKNDVFEEYKDTLGIHELANQLSYIPDINLKKKYNNLNNILIVFLSIIGLFNIINLVTTFGNQNIYISLILLFKTIAIITFIYFIGIKFGLIYKVISLLSVLEILQSQPFNVISNTNIVGIIIFMIILSVPVITIFLQFKMFPYLGLHKAQKDLNGVVVFTTLKKKVSNLSLFK